jgi:hypothetical protein
MIINIYGVEKPKAIKVKVKNMNKLFCWRLKNKALPRKGAVQGVDKIVAITPLK